MIEVVNTDHLGFKNVLNLVAYQVINGLQLQFGCQSFLNAVDDLQLCRTLLGLFEQVLSLLKQTHVLDGSAHIRRDGLKHTNWKVSKGVFFIVVCNSNATDNFLACQQREHHKGLRKPSNGKFTIVLFSIRIDHPGSAPPPCSKADTKLKLFCCILVRSKTPSLMINVLRKNEIFFGVECSNADTVDFERLA